ncbi:MAG: 50S ribosomal protein L4 [Chlamydiae bacterium]|nr:MAG: 50S ribosomal protein L4 [Chlamydiota bacterium]
MAILTKINIAGENIGEVEVAESLCSATYKPELAHAVYVAIMASQRSGNACTKTKGEVKASGSKPWRQKGTGRARAGYKASPVWRGGGVVFGPKPRSYDKKVNKRDKKAAFYGILAEIIRENKISVIENWDLEVPKTKVIAALKDKLGSRKLLCIGEVKDISARLSARNVPATTFVEAGSLNVIDLADSTEVIISESGLKLLESRCE